MTEAFAQPKPPEDFTEEFWLLLERNMGCMVPSYLKHILRVRGYDNAASIGTLTTDDIDKVQEYFRTKLKRNADHNFDKKIFFHAFHNDGDDFEILPGHVKLIEKIVHFINSMTKLHGPGYFDPRIERNVRRPESRVMIRPNRIRGLQKVLGNTTPTQTIIVQNQIQPNNSSLVPSVHKNSASSVTSEEPPQLSFPEGPPVPSADIENVGDVPSDDPLTKFIADERDHLIKNIRVWMEKNVPVLFERYSGDLVPAALEAITESAQHSTDNIIENQLTGDDSNDLMVLVFRFCCPMCPSKIRSTQQKNTSGETYFSLSNIERHWKIHAQDRSKKPKKTKEKKRVSSKPLTRKLRSKEPSECEAQEEECDDVEYEVLSDDNEDEDSREFKIVSKRKTSSRKN